MDVQPGFEELLALFNAHKVKYLVVSGYALAFYGSPRAIGRKKDAADLEALGE